MEDKKFKERQKYGLEAVGIVVLLAVILLYRFVEQIFFKAPTANSDFLAYFVFVFILGGALYYLLHSRLVTRIDHKRIKYRLISWGVRKREIKWEDVKTCNVINVPLAAELNGWGIHFRDFDSEARLCGGSGLYLKLKSGEEVFIGTRRPAELESFIDQLELG